MSITRSPSKIPPIMEADDLAPWIAACSAELRTIRHTDLTISGYIDCARHFAACLAVNNIGLDEVDDRS
jgi:integrase/recombinase XerD